MERVYRFGVDSSVLLHIDWSDRTYTVITMRSEPMVLLGGGVAAYELESRT